MHRVWMVVAAGFIVSLGLPPSSAVAADAPRVSVARIPNSTAATARLEGEMDAPAWAVQAVLCDLEAHPKFSPTSELVAVVTDEEAAAIRQSPPRKRAAVESQVVPGRRVAECPGRTHVLSLLDYPFPLGDGWSLAVYEGAVTGTSFRLVFDTLAGPDKGAGEYRVDPLPDGRSSFRMRYVIDLGVKMPEFMLGWAMNKQLPKIFNSLQELAQAHAQR